MRILVAPHNFEIGGSQINALELAHSVSQMPGFEVILYAPDGELAERARATGLEVHFSSLRESAPSPMRIGEMSRLVLQRKVDLVHTYEWAPTVDAAIGIAWAQQVPVLSTVLSMDYPYFLPRDLPTIFGTREMCEIARGEGRKAFLIEPPVDTDLFRPNAIPQATIDEIRSECQVGEGDILVVVIGRLAAALKLDGLIALVQAAGRLSRDYPIRLALVGDGPVRDQIQLAADAVNKSANRNIVNLLGARSDPLPYYSAADLVVGMGSSALRAMSIGKPLLVQGEKGFWRVADESSVDLFRSQGWYGIGNDENSVDRCVEELRILLTASQTRLLELGEFGRELVQRDYSLRAAAQYLASIYQEVSSAPTVSKARGLVNSLNLIGEIAKYHASIKAPWLRTAIRRSRGL